MQCSPANNNYLNCSSFHEDGGGELRARKEHFAACHFVMLDDLGTKVPMEMLGDLQLSWMLETSPGNFQGGVIFTEPITDRAQAEDLLDAIIDAGLCDRGSSGAGSRWARLPVGINGKPKYRSGGNPFTCRLTEWHPERRNTPAQVIDLLKLKPQSRNQAAKEPVAARAAAAPIGVDDNPAYTPSAEEHPVVTALKSRGLYKRLISKAKHDITCPWVEEHTDALDTGAAYFEPSAQYPAGGFRCQHSHGDSQRLGELLRHLGLGLNEARNRPLIRVEPGGLHDVVDAAERVLIHTGRFYQTGGLITTIDHDPVTKDPRIAPATVSTLSLELSRVADWEKRNERGQLVKCDPPQKHVKTLIESQEFRYLPQLTGFARQPFFREQDGELIMSPGLDEMTGRYGVFEGCKYDLPEPTRAEAEKALALLNELLAEFHFAKDQDRAVTLAAILTAVVRPTLATAPAFHVQASTPGSGKTYLCELIGLFAGAAPNQKVSYPTSAEEASKMMLSVLMPGPAVVEFDDMDHDWHPHSAIKRALTADKTSDRILGASKTATVSTRTLFLGSGNNVGPVRDLLRRVMTIYLEPQVQSPATLRYNGSPIARVRKDRERYVVAALTIIRAWKAAGSSREAPPIASYGDAWADYCRHPLIWLGVPDPVATIIEQIASDPEGETLGRLMSVWGKAFGTTPTMVRSVAEAALFNEDLMEAITAFPVTTPRGGIDKNKLGWFLKKRAGRIVNGHKFTRVDLSERTAWALLPVEAAKGANRVAAFPPSPPLPSQFGASQAQVAEDLEAAAF